MPKRQTKKADPKFLTYERLVARAVEAILRYKGHRNVKVSHNEKLPARAKTSRGRSVERQADVYAEFIDQGPRRLVVQAKHYKRAISLPIVDSLTGMLESLVTRCDGMLVTPSRYQSGAAGVALEQGLNPCIITGTRPEHFSNGIVPRVDCSIGFYWFESENMQIQLEAGLPEEALQAAALRKDRPTVLVDATGREIADQNLLSNEIQEFMKSQGLTEHEGEFHIREELYMKVEGYPAPLKITGIRGKFKRSLRAAVPLKYSAEYIFHSMLDEETLLLDEYMNVYKADDFSPSSSWIDMREIFPEWFETEVTPVGQIDGSDKAGVEIIGAT